MKFSHKFNLIIFLVVLITSILIGSSVFLSAKTILRQEIQNNQLYQAKQTMRDIDRLLNNTLQQIQSISQDARFVDTISETIFTEENRKSYKRILKEKFISTGPWTELMLISKHGSLIASTHRSVDSKNLQNTSALNLAYQQALLGKTYYSDLVITDIGRRPGIIFSAPIKKIGKVNIDGVVIGIFEWHAVLQILKKIKLPNHAHLYNRKHELIGRSLGTMSDHSSLIFYSKILSDIEKISDDKKQSNGVLINDENSLLFGAYILQKGEMNFKGNHWRLLIDIPREIAFAPIYKLTIEIIILIFFEMLILAGIAYFMSRHLTRPIEDLCETMKSVSNGVFNIRANTIRDDELGHLANTFNQMLDNINTITISKDYLNNIIGSMNDSLIVVNNHAKIKMVNQSVLNLLDYGDKDLIGQDIYKIVEEEEEERLQSLLRLFKHKSHNLIKENHFINQELIFIAKNGHKTTLLCSGSLIHSKDNILQEIVLVGHDITERIQYELQLKEAKEKAELANQAKSTFLSRMSHELRTPLNAIMGFSNLLLMTNKDQGSENNKEAYEHILTAADHLLMIVNDILDIVNIEQKDIRITTENCPLDKVVNDSIKLVQLQAQEHHIDIHYEPSHSIVTANFNRLKQVLINLLTNAIKYNRKGGSITIEVDENKINHMTLSVKDTGIGISPDDLEFIFEPFNRLPYAEIQEIQGTGIGLTITKHLVQQMNGTIGVDSQLGLGSIFWVQFPKSKTAIEEESTTIQPTNNHLIKSENNFSVLYVEDDPASRYLFEKFVEHFDNINLYIAHTAEDGIKIAETVYPNLIFLDIQLPKMDGITAVKTLRLNPKFKQTMIFALSADAYSDTKEKAMQAGFNGYLTKPIEFTQLTKVFTDVNL
jgi:PAS domain S-box-containing protein